MSGEKSKVVCVYYPSKRLRKRRVLVWFLVLMVIPIVVTLRVRPTVNGDKAITLANAEFKRAGFDPEKYKCTANYERKERRWVIHFDSREKFPTPGSSHIVFVDANDETAKLARGE